MYLVEIIVTRIPRDGGCIGSSVPLRIHYNIYLHPAGSRVRVLCSVVPPVHIALRSCAREWRMLR